MKGMGIVELVAMLALKRQQVPLKADIVFLGVADEEAGGAAGARFIVKDHFDLLIPSCFQDETNCGTVVIWRDHDRSTKGWWRKRGTS